MVLAVVAPEEPEDAGPEDLPQEDDEGGEVEDVDHADQPVDEHGGPGRQCEARHPVPGGLRNGEGEEKRNP